MWGQDGRGSKLFRLQMGYFSLISLFVVQMDARALGQTLGRHRKSLRENRYPRIPPNWAAPPDMPPPRPLERVPRLLPGTLGNFPGCL